MDNCVALNAFRLSAQILSNWRDLIYRHRSGRLPIASPFGKLQKDRLSAATDWRAKEPPMLKSADLTANIPNGFCGSFGESGDWPELPRQAGVRQARFFLGDPAAGPLVWLFKNEPTVFPQDQPRPNHTQIFPHLHRSPTFRITLAPQEKQVRFDGEWMGKGDYVLLDANKVYSDPAGYDGVEILLVFADRGAVHPASRATAEMSHDDTISWLNSVYGDFKGGLPKVHMSNADATTGAAITTMEELRHGGRGTGNIYDTDAWTSLSDGSQVAICLMGDVDSGPVVVMSRNVAGAKESPTGRIGSDRFRFVVDGSCTVGSRSFASGSYIAESEGTMAEEVVHGPDGSTQILVLADRRHIALQDGMGGCVESDRLREIEALILPYLSKNRAAAA